MSSLLLAWVLVLTPQQSDQQFEQQRQELRQIQQQLQLQQEELERLTELLEEQQDLITPLCAPELRLVNSAGRVGPELEASLPLNLFATMGRSRRDCLGGEIHLTANYFDRNGNLICSGMIENAATQRNSIQSINLEVRPWNLREFVRWVNQPERVGAPRSFVCVSPDGLTQATSIEPGQAQSLLIHSTLLPAGGGFSTAEFQIDLLP